MIKFPKLQNYFSLHLKKFKFQTTKLFSSQFYNWKILSFVLFTGHKVGDKFKFARSKSLRDPHFPNPPAKEPHAFQSNNTIEVRNIELTFFWCDSVCVEKKYRILRTIGRYFFSSTRWLRPIVHIDLYKDEVKKIWNP